MSFSSGLAGIKKIKQELAERREAMNTKAEWLTLKNKPNGVVIRFLQELDEDGQNYDSNKGVVLVTVEHQAPGKEGWKARAACTFESEGRCYACEMNAREPQKGWKQKNMMYLNVFDEAEKSVKILSRNINNSFVDTLMDWYSESGTITGNSFKLKQTGEGFNTSWSMVPTATLAKDVDFSGLELYDLEKVAVRQIPYPEQEAYYNRVLVEEKPMTEEEKKEAIDSMDWI